MTFEKICFSFFFEKLFFQSIYFQKFFAPTTIIVYKCIYKNTHQKFIFEASSNSPLGGGDVLCVCPLTQIPEYTHIYLLSGQTIGVKPNEVCQFLWIKWSLKIECIQNWILLNIFPQIKKIRPNSIELFKLC